MAMDVLRWILLGVGALVILAIYVWEKRRSRRLVDARYRMESADDAQLAGELQRLSNLLAAARQNDLVDDRGPSDDDRAFPAFERPNGHTLGALGDLPPGGDRRSSSAVEPTLMAESEAVAGRPPAPSDGPSAEVEANVAPPETGRPPGQETPSRGDQQDELVIALTVLGRNGRHMRGAELLSAFQEAGMVHGEMGIFHKMASSPQGDAPLYSAANVLKPGTFDLDHMDEVATPGVALFMRLPGPGESTSTFKQLVATADRLASRLDAEVYDANRRPLDHRGFRTLWDKVLDFEARQRDLDRPLRH